MDRTAEYFYEKYGDLPHVVVTPEDFKLIVGSYTQLLHAENGDPASREHRAHGERRRGFDLRRWFSELF